MKALYKFILLRTHILCVWLFFSVCQNNYNAVHQAKSSVVPRDATLVKELEKAIPRPIWQADAKQLIGAMAPGEVLSILVTPENFPSFDLAFNPLIAVVRGDDQQNLIFLPR